MNVAMRNMESKQFMTDTRLITICIQDYFILCFFPSCNSYEIGFILLLDYLHIIAVSKIPYLRLCNAFL